MRSLYPAQKETDRQNYIQMFSSGSGPNLFPDLVLMISNFCGVTFGQNRFLNFRFMPVLVLIVVIIINQSHKKTLKFNACLRHNVDKNKFLSKLISKH